MRRALLALSSLAVACAGGEEPAPPPASAKILSFTATPSRLRAGESATLSWETEGGTGVAIEPSVGLQPPTGSVKVRPIGRTVYTLKLRVGEEVLTSQATVEVDGGAPTIERFAAEPRTVQHGEAATLSWRAINSSRVTIRPDLGDQPPEGSVIVRPEITTTYLLTASGDVGSTTQDVTVVVASGNQPFIRLFSASAQSVAPNTEVTLEWDVFNAESVSINPDLGSGPPSGSATVMPARTTVYTLVAVGPGGMASASVTVDVTASGEPTILRFDASPSTIAPGNSAELAWETDNATGVIIEPGVGPRAAKDTVMVSPAATTTYRLTALGTGGAEVHREVTVTVAAPDAPVILELSASPRAVIAGGSSTLTWRTMNAASVDITPGVGTALTPDGSIQISPAATTTYVLTARSASGATATESLEITVTAAPPAVTAFTANPASVTAGQPVTLSWSTSSASSVTIDGVGPVMTSGTVTVTPSATTNYTLTATGPGGMVTSQVTVTVTPAGAPVIASFGASPPQISPGGNAMLSWSTTNATRVRIDNGVGNVATSGMTSVSPSVTTTFTLTAEGPGGTTSAPVTVVVASANGDQCASAFEISASGTFTGNTLTAVDDYRDVAACSGYASPGADQVYRVSLQAGDRLRATLTPSAPVWDASLYLLTSCAQIAASCVAGSDRGNPETIDYVAGSAGTYYLVIDAATASAGGAYSLLVELNPAALPNDACNGALPIGSGGTFPGSTRGGRNDYDPGAGGCTAYAEAGNDVTYQVTLATGERLEAVLTATWDSALYVVRDCAQVRATCAAGSDRGNPERVVFTAPSAGTYYVVVDGYGRAMGDYSLTVSVSPPVQGGELCSNAVVVPAAGASFMSTTTGLADDYRPPLTCTGFAQEGPDRAYRVDLARGDVLEALAEFGPALDGSIYLATDCNALATSCLAGSDLGDVGEAESVRHVARTAGAHHLIVDASLGAWSGSHELSVLTYSGDTCGSAAPLETSGRAEWLLTSGRANDYSPNAGGCTGFSASGEDRVYTVGLRPGDQLEVSVDPDTGYDTSIYLVQSCSDVSGSCVAGSDHTGNVVERIAPVVQQGGTYYLVVDGFSGSDGTGTITATIAHGDTCGDAYTVPTGGGTFLGTTSGYAANYGISTRAGSCTGWQQDGADAVYRVDLGPNQRIDATLTTTWDGSLYLIGDCAQPVTSCVAGRDAGNPETLTFTNGATRRTYYLVVDSWRASPTHQGNYSLRITIP